MCQRRADAVTNRPLHPQPHAAAADAGAVIIARSNTKEARVLASIRLYAQLLGKYLRPYWPVVALVGLLMLGATVLQVVAPQIVRRFIDLASEQGDLDSLYMAAVLFLGAGISVHLLQALYKYMGRGIAWRATNRLRLDLTLHVLRLDMGFHNAHTPGELLERIDGDVERLANFFSQLFVQLVSALLLMAGLIIATWLEDWRFGLAVAVSAAFFLVTRVRLLYFLMPFWEVEGEARAQLYGFLGERITGIRGHPEERRRPVHHGPPLRDPAPPGPVLDEGRHRGTPRLGGGVHRQQYPVSAGFGRGGLLVLPGRHNHRDGLPDMALLPNDPHPGQRDIPRV